MISCYNPGESRIGRFWQLKVPGPFPPSGLVGIVPPLPTGANLERWSYRTFRGENSAGRVGRFPGFSTGGSTGHDGKYDITHIPGGIIRIGSPDPNQAMPRRRTRDSPIKIKENYNF
jgi:hypothetical protein